VTNTGLQALQSLPELTSLNINLCWNCFDVKQRETTELTFLQDMNHLASLNVSELSITSHGLAQFAALKNTLTSLNLYDCRTITDEGLTHLAAGLCITTEDGSTRSKLLSLNMGDCHEITATGVATLAKNFTSLTSLNLNQCCNIRDTLCLNTLSTSLLSLDIGGWDVVGCGSINPLLLPADADGGLQFLKNLPHLASLRLRGCQNINSVDLGYLAPIVKDTLVSLDLCLCKKITDQGLGHLKSLTKLTSLDISCIPGITEKGIRDLWVPLPALADFEIGPQFNLPAVLKTVVLERERQKKNMPAP
jgi:hypothetical protein